MSALDARLAVARGAFRLEAELALAEGEVLALLGPNGAGKSTLLGALAGLIAPTAGHVAVGGRDLTRVEARRKSLQVPPARRGIGLLGQEPRLFPHLTALANVAFGPHAHGQTRRAARADAAGWLERVGLGGQGDRRPAELSGGQQQRVAIARALAARPAVLLLDEPLASLDVETAPGIRQLLREQLHVSGTAAIVVSHDVLDAVVLAGRTAVLVDGRIVDEGPTARVLAAPRTAFTAAIAGVNLVAGVAEAGTVVGDGGIRFTGQGEVGEHGQPTTLADGTAAAAVFRPASVIVATRRPEGASPRNAWRARVTGLEQTTAGIRVQTGPVPVAADLTAASVAELRLAPGSEVWLSVKAAEVGLHGI